MQPGRTAFLFCPPLPPLALSHEGKADIGRHSSCAFTLRRDDVSRHHAAVYFEQGQFFLRDLGSTNGTFLNGDRVTEPKPLVPGDRIEVGSSALTFCAIEGEPDAYLPGVDPGDTQTRIYERNPARDAFSGDLSEIPPFVLLQVLEMGTKSGVLEIESGDGLGRIFFETGRPVHAETSKRHGFDAALELVNASPGKFRFESQAVETERTIEASVTELLLEASKTLDELAL